MTGLVTDVNGIALMSGDSVQVNNVNMFESYSLSVIAYFVGNREVGETMFEFKQGSSSITVDVVSNGVSYATDVFDGFTGSTMIWAM